MKKGLVLGKFMPLHKGHLALIDFALQHCDHLTILLCYHEKEPVSGEQRTAWLNKIFAHNSAIRVLPYAYDPNELTDSSEPNPEHARRWAAVVKTLIPDVVVFFSSEKYGQYVAGFLSVKHVLFDERRKIVPVSASLIRERPLTYWDFLPPVVQPGFVKKIVLAGTESTGKSVLAEMLATHYETTFVPEMARAIINHTEECTYEHLVQIAALHAQTIVNKTQEANKLLFCDTDINTTKSYAQFLFQKVLVVPQWIEEANKADLYLFLESDCPYVQDGTRLPEKERKALSEGHKEELRRNAIRYKTISGDWEQRFVQACKETDDFIKRF